MKLIFFLVLSILVGLSITIGIVTITIGKLNLISVAFAVLFIGLSVDYGIQILSRIFEKQNKMNRDALIFEVSNISKTLFLGFYSVHDWLFIIYPN